MPLTPFGNAPHVTAGGGWTPASLPSLISWFDFSDTSKITSSSNAVSDVAPSGGSSSAHLVQATGTNQPLTATDTINGLNVIKFDGTNDFMTAAIGTLTDPTTILMVVKYTAVSSRIPYDSNDSAHRHQTWPSGVTWSIYAGTIADTAKSTSTSVAQQVVTLFNGASSLFYLNGSASATLSAGTQTMGNLRLGTDASGSGAYQGDIAEIAVMNASISAGDRTNWNTYCARWGL